MIEGVKVKPLIVNVDERGVLMEILRSDDAIFQRFAQVYVSLNYPGVVRAWHFHKKQDDLIAVIKGMCKLVVYDSREGSATQGQTQEFCLGERNNLLVGIPAGVMHGYKTIGTEPSLLVNFPTELYDRSEPDEYRIAWNSPEVPYDWALRNR